MGRPQATVPPWHLWGNSAQAVVPPSSLFVSDPSRTFVSSTIVKVAYGRPETWRFQYGAELVSGPTVGIGITAETNIDFTLITGVGRAVMRRRLDLGRDIFNYRWGGGITPESPPVGLSTWINAMPSGMRTEDIVTDIATNTEVQRIDRGIATDHFVAETITVEATCNFIVSLPLPLPATLGPLVLNLNFQLSPITHVRPDWYEIEPVFAGGETEGR